MSSATSQLLAQYETLPVTDKQEFVNALLRRMPPLDSGALEDDDLAAAGDQVAAMLDKEENDAAA
jgi:hypothetical protein